ncbi:MAG: DUF1972 domain-containing protein [Candidatus Omnitrophica bacterium]|nr:DUF1972 domain-containing protein [Candidatus Omnitrophota bacterium]
MKIAIVGTRGIPAKYGGFETCAEELSVGLAKKGHKVLVSCRRYLYEGLPASYRDVGLCYPPSIPGKSTDTFSHTLFSMVRALLWSPDAILVFNSANSPLALLPKLLGKKTAINVDGLEWRRAKWGRAAKLYYKFAEFFSSIIADAVVSDAMAIKDYYLRKYGRESVYIPYGAHTLESRNPGIVKKYNLEKGGYFFIGSRLEPENHQDMAVEAFGKIHTDKMLAIAGGANWKSPYVKKLREVKDKRILFLGPVYKDGHIEELHCSAFAYIHGNEVGGTNPALLKAMGSGNCIIALDVLFNREVLGDAGLYFSSAESLKEKAEFILQNPEQAGILGEKARERVKKLYRWEKVVEDYEKLFMNLIASR